MIDTKVLINDFEQVAKQLSIKKVDETLLDELKNIAIKYKTSKQELESLQAFQNKTSKLFGEYKKEHKDISELQK